MSSASRSRLFVVVTIAAAVCVILGLALGAYFLWFRWDLPGPDSPRYRDYVDNFEVGLAALDTERSQEIGGEYLDRAVQIIPDEPAAWADRGLMYLRANQFEQASKDLAKAHQLAPESPDVEALLGWLAAQQGKYTDAVAHFRKAVQARPRGFRYIYALAQAVRQENAPGADAEYQRLMEDGLKIQPTNLLLLRERLDTAVHRRDQGAVNDVIERFHQLAAEWDDAAKAELEAFAKAANPLSDDTQNAFNGFSNVLLAQPGFTRSADAAAPAASMTGVPVAQFLRLAPMRAEVPPPDLATTFVSEPLKPGAAPANAIWAVWLAAQDCQPTIYMADGREVRRADGSGSPLTFPGGAQETAPSAFGVAAADFDNDFRTDFLLAGAGGLRFWRQRSDGSFADVTAKTKLPPNVLGGDYYGVWAADVDLDGDLDFIVAPRNGAPVVLRNNGDGTFTAIKDVFPGVADVRDFAWADFNHDGAPDAAFLDAHGKVTVLFNQRHGQFTLSPLPDPTVAGLALAVADVNDDGVMDLVVFGSDWVVRRFSYADDGWASAELGSRTIYPNEWVPGQLRLLVADLDNNGALDLVASTPADAFVWMGAGPDKFQPLPAAVSERVCAAADLDGSGRLDLLGLSAEGRPDRLRNAGAKNYHWRDIRPAANDAEIRIKGDNRINSFGIGAEVEIRTGLLVQKQPVTGPSLHFGLGDHEKVNVMRIVWPNGDPQVEFALNEVQPCVGVKVQQRLHGSCPFLFTWDGDRMQFIADILWSSPLGLYINAQDRGGISQTTDWVKVRGDQLRPRDGVYDVRITADLWETHYFDHVHLTVVDHPADTEMYVDERFFLTPTEPQLYLTRPPRPVARALDDNSDDVTDLVRKIDGRYLNTFDLGKYQGVAADHYVEVDLGDDAPKTGPVYLLATGFIHPTNSSINAALEQGHGDRPRGLVLEVPDGKGGWTVGLPALGFPAGKNKTIVIRLDGIPGQDGVARRFRLRTNMEIYWDALEYAEGLDASQARQTVLMPETADLHHRGISRITQADARSPELPDYDKLVTRGQYWRDLIGWCTRYGDVRELLEKIDDRYVIMNAGDEIAMTFRPPPDQPPGWRRDFVWVSDGWEKDGDFNTRFSKTVLPLPYHGMNDYETPPGRLQDDPVYRRFPDDWKKFHTRYVTPYEFQRGLRLLTPDRP
jgi:tetratricopeptide (TPR) repeat protein